MSKEYIPELSKEQLRKKLIELKDDKPNHYTRTKEFELLKENILFYTKEFDKFNSKFTERTHTIINILYDRPKCYCGNYVNYNKYNYYIFCCYQCAQSNKKTQEKRKHTCLTKYNNENYNNITLQKETVDNFSKSKRKIINEKRKKTKLNRYDDENYNNRDKARETCLNKYNDLYYNNRDKARETGKNIEKYKQTCLNRYNVEWPMQNEEIFNKSQIAKYKKKEFIFPSGKIVYVQGYEPKILNELVKHFNEDDIVCGKNLPEIWYTLNDKKKRYFPDIYIKSKNMIIEVKSTYTLEADLEKNLAKRQACLDLGYNFWFSVGHIF